MERVLTDQQLESLLADDAPFGDLTTSLLLAPKHSIHIELTARYDMTVSGVEEAARMFELKGATATVLVSSGDHCRAGDHILNASGNAHALFLVWKSAQVLIEWMSGVASCTASMVQNAKGMPIACTRKQVPNTKALSVKAIRSGGGIMHRLGSSESILVFAEHRQFSSLTPRAMLHQFDKKSPEHKPVVEVHSVEDAMSWLDARAPVLQLDKFTPEQITVCRQFIQEHQLNTKLGIAGGVNPNNVVEFVAAGADFIVTSFPYYAKPKDVQVRFFEA
ncbi:ModD protein [Vibrio sp. CAIM 722]|uniref:Putative pyrophosphorylase ModD n=1 Tax=Vibrio eleionomae TaxID=2653505 RepID=A0A7X4LNF9_9VIBR|nr:ModD protein [Vibrio eleionomae]MZI95134.1 ModD protein [Vibrio eleionomae]